MDERFSAFTLLIAKISRAIRKIKAEEMKEYNLKCPHVSCLYYLHKQGVLTAKQLCDICDEDKAAISRSIDYLESNGFIACASSAKKRYNAELRLTETGERVAKDVAKKIDRILDEASKGLTEDERAVMYKSLALISDNLHNLCEKYGD